MIDKLKVELQTTNSSHKEFADKMKVETRKFEGKIREQEEDIHNLQKQLYQSEQQLEGTLRQLNTMEIDYSRLATKNDDDSEDVSQLRHQIYEMHANLEELKEAGGQQSQEIAELTEDNNRLAHKCHTFKNAIKELNNKVKSWEKSYRDQSDLLLTYSREISRLNGGRSY
jgi:chromosome segregation ATPase